MHLPFPMFSPPLAPLPPPFPSLAGLKSIKFHSRLLRLALTWCWKRGEVQILQGRWEIIHFLAWIFILFLCVLTQVAPLFPPITQTRAGMFWRKSAWKRPREVSFYLVLFIYSLPDASSYVVLPSPKQYPFRLPALSQFTLLPRPVNEQCSNKHSLCVWAGIGECEKNPVRSLFLQFDDWPPTFVFISHIESLHFVANQVFMETNCILAWQSCHKLIDDEF